MLYEHLSIAIIQSPVYASITIPLSNNYRGQSALQNGKEKPKKPFLGDEVGGVAVECKAISSFFVFSYPVLLFILIDLFFGVLQVEIHQTGSLRNYGFVLPKKNARTQRAHLLSVP